MSAHTPEPWRISGRGSYISSSSAGYVPLRTPFREDAFRDVSAHNNKELEDNAARIVACVNACDGINPEAVPDLLAAAEQALLMEGFQGWPGAAGSTTLPLKDAHRPVFDALCAAIASAKGE